MAINTKREFGRNAEDSNATRGKRGFTYDKYDFKDYAAKVRALITCEGVNMNDETALEKIEEYVFSQESSEYHSFEDNANMVCRLFLSLRCELDILQPYVDDKSITEIMVNGKDNIFVERRGAIEKLAIAFDSTEDLEELIRRIASRVHREINELNPIVDARLSDGSRVNAVYKNIALNGPILTIRKFPEKAMNMNDLITNKSINSEAAEFLKVLVKAGYNIFISGGTSSGKTTLLNVLAQTIPPVERLVVIEDSAELQIEHVKNIVRLECKTSNVQGKGEIDMAQLVKASLRMRPDRIVIGEVRGKEVMDMIQALNTGHSGSLSTGHANSIGGMLKRLEAMFLQAADFPVEAIRSQIAEGIDIIVHMSRLRDGSRKVMEIAELVEFDGRDIIVNSLYKYSGEYGDAEMISTGNRIVHREKLELAGLDI